MYDSLPTCSLGDFLYYASLLVVTWCIVLGWQATIQLLLDPEVLLGLYCIMPLLEAVDTLCIFAQHSDIYVYDFMAALDICKAQLYSLFVDRGTSFGKDEF
jgi:hypothetical protein